MHLTGAISWELMEEEWLCPGKWGGCSSEPATLHVVACGYGWFQAGHLESKGGWICSPEVLWTLSAGLFSDLSFICMPELSSLEEPSA